MSAKLFSLIQHKLIPAALLAVNLSLAHLVYLIANEGNPYALILTALSLIILITGILRSNRNLLLTGTVFYTLLLFFSLV